MSLSGRRVWVLAFAAVTVGLLLGACGQGESGSAAGFAKDYGSVTARYSAQLERAKVQGRAASGGGTDAVLAVYGEIRDVTQAAAEDYEALAAPDGAQDELAKLSDAIGAQVDALDDVLKAAKNGDASGTQAALTAYARALSDWGTARQVLDDVIEQDSARAGPG